MLMLQCSSNLLYIKSKLPTVTSLWIIPLYISIQLYYNYIVIYITGYFETSEIYRGMKNWKKYAQFVVLESSASNCSLEDHN